MNRYLFITSQLFLYFNVSTHLRLYGSIFHSLSASLIIWFLSYDGVPCLQYGTWVFLHTKPRRHSNQWLRSTISHTPCFYYICRWQILKLSSFQFCQASTFKRPKTISFVSTSQSLDMSMLTKDELFHFTLKVLNCPSLLSTSQRYFCLRHAVYFISCRTVYWSNSSWRLMRVSRRN